MTMWYMALTALMMIVVLGVMEWCDLYEVEDERGGSVPHAALAFGRHAVGLLQCVPVGDGLP